MLTPHTTLGAGLHHMGEIGWALRLTEIVSFCLARHILSSILSFGENPDSCRLSSSPFAADSLLTPRMTSPSLRPALSAGLGVMTATIKAPREPYAPGGRTRLGEFP